MRFVLVDLDANPLPGLSNIAEMRASSRGFACAGTMRMPYALLLMVCFPLIVYPSPRSRGR